MIISREVAIIMIDAVSRGRALFNNSHFLVARLASPHFAPTLEARYRRLSSSLVPQILDGVKQTLGGEKNVNFIALLGSASTFRYYADIDLAVGISQCPVRTEKLHLNVVDESTVKTEKEVEIFYHDMGKINEQDYIRFIHSKPALYGTVPSLFKGRLKYLLSFAFTEALEKAGKSIDENAPKTADHLLMAACRHAFSLHTEFDSPLPTSFVRVVTKLVSLDHRSDGSILRLASIKAVIEDWRSELGLAD